MELVCIRVRGFHLVFQVKFNNASLSWGQNNWLTAFQLHLCNFEVYHACRHPWWSWPNNLPIHTDWLLVPARGLTRLPAWRHCQLPGCSSSMRSQSWPIGHITYVYMIRPYQSKKNKTFIHNLVHHAVYRLLYYYIDVNQQKHTYSYTAILHHVVLFLCNEWSFDYVALVPFRLWCSIMSHTAPPQKSKKMHCLLRVRPIQLGGNQMGQTLWAI